MLGQKPRNDAGIGNHLATACLIAQMIADQSAQFILKEAMNRAGRRHRARLAVDEFISAPVVRVPFEELVDGHPNRNFGQHTVLIARIVPSGYLPSPLLDPARPGWFASRLSSEAAKGSATPSEHHRIRMKGQGPKRLARSRRSAVHFADDVERQPRQRSRR